MKILQLIFWLAVIKLHLCFDSTTFKKWKHSNDELVNRNTFNYNGVSYWTFNGYSVGCSNPESIRCATRMLIMSAQSDYPIELNTSAVIFNKRIKFTYSPLACHVVKIDGTDMLEFYVKDDASNIGTKYGRCLIPMQKLVEGFNKQNGLTIKEKLDIIAECSYISADYITSCQLVGTQEILFFLQYKDMIQMSYSGMIINVTKGGERIVDLIQVDYPVLIYNTDLQKQKKVLLGGFLSNISDPDSPYGSEDGTEIQYLKEIKRLNNIIFEQQEMLSKKRQDEHNGNLNELRKDLTSKADKQDVNKVSFEISEINRKIDANNQEAIARDEKLVILISSLILAFVLFCILILVLLYFCRSKKSASLPASQDKEVEISVEEIPPEADIVNIEGEKLDENTNLLMDTVPNTPKVQTTLAQFYNDYVRGPVRNYLAKKPPRTNRETQKS